MDKKNIKEWLNSKCNEPAYLLAYFVDKVSCGTYDGNDLHWEEDVNLDYLMELRLFNNQREIHGVFDETELILESEINDENTLIVDDSKDIVEKLLNAKDKQVAYDDYLFVLGTKKDGDYLEQQGRRIKLPKLPFEWHESSNPVRLQVRNYIDFDVTGNSDMPQAMVKKSRIVGFTTKEKNNV